MPTRENGDARPEAEEGGAQGDARQQRGGTRKEDEWLPLGLDGDVALYSTVNAVRMPCW
jgi:hypothetical protein